MEAPPTGPYVKAAFFCEKMLQEADGVPSFIRVVDRINQTAVSTEAPANLPPVKLPLVLVVMLNPGSARGSANFEIGVEPPNAIRTTLASGTVHFEAPDQPANIRADVDIAYEQQGTYWFDVKVDGTLMSKMPLTVRYNRVTPGPAMR